MTSCRPPSSRFSGSQPIRLSLRGDPGLSVSLFTSRNGTRGVKRDGDRRCAPAVAEVYQGHQGAGPDEQAGHRQMMSRLLRIRESVTDRVCPLRSRGHACRSRSRPSRAARNDLEEAARSAAAPPRDYGGGGCKNERVAPPRLSRQPGRPAGVEADTGCLRGHWYPEVTQHLRDARAVRWSQVSGRPRWRRVFQNLARLIAHLARFWKTRRHRGQLTEPFDLHRTARAVAEMLGDLWISDALGDSPCQLPPRRAAQVDAKGAGEPLQG